MKNARNLLVKEMIKAEVLNENVKYQKMYSNIKKDGELRVKLFGISDNKLVEKIANKIKALSIGRVEVLKSPYMLMDIKSIVVYVDADNII